jgi:hypothetical protein
LFEIYKKGGYIAHFHLKVLLPHKLNLKTLYMGIDRGATVLFNTERIEHTRNFLTQPKLSSSSFEFTVSIRIPCCTFEKPASTLIWWWPSTSGFFHNIFYLFEFLNKKTGALNVMNRKTKVNSVWRFMFSTWKSKTYAKALCITEIYIEVKAFSAH